MPSYVQGDGERRRLRQARSCAFARFSTVLSSRPGDVPTTAKIKILVLCLFVILGALWSIKGTSETSIQKHGFKSGKDHDLGKVDEAVELLSRHPDHEAVAAIGAGLALRRGGKMNRGDDDPIHLAGIKVLRRLPDQKGKQLVDLLARTVTEKIGRTGPEDIKELQKQLLEKE
ncbi:MAG: hypothetical protein HY360_18290 [Verrucomicrobia bacterium]|nr:hypothetical protein [Verrucomicrobiota bacterium]